MPSASLLVNLLSALFIPFVFGETEIRFAGQTKFVVNETSTTVIRLVIERIGEPANVTAIVSLYGDDTGDFFDTYAAAFIPIGETNRTVYIAVCDDDLPEPDETFIFHLTLQKPPANVKLGWPRTVTVTILSNDNAFGIISFNMPFSVTVSEPRGRNESVPLTLIREKGTYGMVTVTFEVESGPNPPEEDLSPVKGNITFPPGRATVVYNLTVLDDEVPENDEIFLIQLKSVEGGAEINTSRSSVEIIIKKNDSPVRFLQNVYLVPEEDHILLIPVVRGKDDNGNLIGSDEYEVSISYVIITGNSTAHAQQNLDFIDLQPTTTIVFPPFIHESHLKFQIVDDTIPEIAESFHVVLLKDTLQGDAVLLGPSIVQITIKPNDKPYGVLSFNSILFERTVVIDEDTTSRFEEITVVRNGGTHGNISVNWELTRNSSDPSPVTADIRPSSGVLHFAQGQMLASIPLTVVNDDLPEEAEAYLLRILPHTIRGGAEVSEPAELLFYIQDSDDVYGLITFFPMENQKIESSPGERYLSLSFTRQGGTKGDVKMFYSALYIPAGAVDTLRAKDGILNMSRRNNLIFPERKTQVTTKLPIRNDAFLQNGAHFLVKLETVELVNIIPPIPPISPRFGEIQNISLVVTPDIANGEIGFISNLPIILHEPEDSAAEVVYIPLHRDGTDGQATVYWSLKPSGFNSKAVTLDDIGPFNGSVVFFSGQSDTTINITVKADDTPEMNETVTLSLDRVNVENQVLKSGYTSRDLIILENDDPGGVFEFSPTSRGPYVIKEGESVELHITRSRGALVKQFLHYRVEPRDSNEFYGNTGVLEFKPGEREIVITLLTRLDGIPELDEHYWVVLSSHGERESKLGSATVVNITILKNDDPHGIIEFVSDDLIVMINETKGDDTYSAVYDVIRNRGTFGNVSVSWVVSPDFTQDVFPVQGTIFFGDHEFSKNITIYSLPDEIPEEMEEFTITLLNATGGAKIGNKTTAILRIRRNDDPIYFAEPRVVRVQEGETANFTVLRNGSVDVACTVQYATMDGKATARDGDFVPIEKGEALVFAVGSRKQRISVFINEDNIPETDEPFYIILFNSTGALGSSRPFGRRSAKVSAAALEDLREAFKVRLQMVCVFIMNRMNSQSSGFTQRRRMALGIVILLLVDVIWVASSELTSYVFTQYNKPFFSTFAKTSMFVLYLLGFIIWKPWRQQCTRGFRGKHAAFFADAEGYFAACTTDTTMNSSLSEPLYVPVKFHDIPSEKPENTNIDAEKTPKKSRVRFSNIMEIRQLPSSHALEAKLSRMSYPTVKEQESLLKTVGKLTTTQVAKISFFFCFVWFLANLSYQEALSDTQVAIVNILSSTSGLFTLILAAVFPSNSGDRFTLSKLLAVILSIGGVVLVNLSGSEKSAGRDTIGSIWSLVGAMLYAVYIVMIKRKVDREDKLDIPMFFGFVGLFNLLLLWPGFFLLHYTGFEDFEFPNKVVLMCIIINGLIGTVLSEFLWLWGCFLTSSLIGTLALSLTIPLSIIADMCMQKVQFSWLFFAGAIPVFFSFFIATLLCHYNNWDPVMVGIRRIFAFICRKHRIQRVPEDSEQCESLIPMHGVSQEDGAS